MDIYLTSKSSGERLRIPLLPDRLNVKTGALPLSFQIIKLGEAKIPRGNALTGYSWNGVFPGASMSNASFIYDWQEPNVIIDLLKQWESQGETLTLMVTETTINDDVFIENFVFEHYGIDNVSYTLNLTHRRELYITTTPPPPVPETKTEEATTQTEETKKQYGTVRTGGSNLNIRAGTSTSTSILGKLKNGSKVEIIGKTGNWYIIPYAGAKDGKAYIYASYVKMDGSGSSGSSSSSGKKSTSSSGTKSKTTSSASSSASQKKTLTVEKPSSKLIDAAKSATKTKVNSLTTYARNKINALIK